MTLKNTVQVEDHPDLVRDLSTQAIINTNTSAYERRLEQLHKIELDKQQTADIEILKKDIAEIKKLLKNIASK